MSKTPAQRHMDRVAQVGCVVCRKIGNGITPAQVHHVKNGTSPRNDFSTAGLCPDHHTGSIGIHTIGENRFCKANRIPGETEYGLLVLVNEYMARDNV